ncbi:hypothetical protein A1O1_08508 [Capronia coronata CBS 617.96]|uniref:Saccharopine dehydrogenase NADP binding domain-containing protein n=1 Tax=Capronia coronata CBS 617.96 TaxID=1182541 RepID=W9YDJ4_9EURO|nr:uncharacterized protein A1O1_08508 [Capronia coronata CBS 617.96]EXJ80364.1 hypothetical protein A1O1_08508 [Capronia coronata CBS 617.96]
MPIKDHGRQYDLVVFGATGYSGQLVAEHIAANLPAHLKWAVSGRSTDKLKKVVERCKVLSQGHSEPEIEVCQLNGEEVSVLARKTFCLIAVVGPYARYGEHAFKACAEAGTHYFDCTPEVPWTMSMIKKYEAMAKASGACMFPQCAMESAPSDLLTWALAAEARKTMFSQICDVVLELHELQSIPSGGTVTTLMNIFDQYSLKTIRQSLKPYALSPVPNDHPAPRKSLLSSLSGVTRVPGLGTLTTSVTGPANAAIVFRTWGLTKQESNLQKEFYGPRFTYREFMYGHGVIGAFLMHYSVLVGAGLILFPPFRSLLKKFFKPGEGPDREKARNESIEFRAVATPDIEPKAGMSKQVFGKLLYTGSMYYLTAALVAQGARTLLEDKSGRLTGGVYTPACLGQTYIDNLGEVGLKVETGVKEF